MPITVDRLENQFFIRLEGEVALASAAELKGILLEWLKSGKNLHLDLERAQEIDITVMQLLWAAGREAARAGIEIEGRMSDAAATAVANAGFERFLAASEHACPGKD